MQITTGGYKDFLFCQGWVGVMEANINQGNIFLWHLYLQINTGGYETILNYRIYYFCKGWVEDWCKVLNIRRKGVTKSIKCEQG